MQRATTPSATASGLPPETTCPVCDAAVRGITTVQPGEHRFVGCGHYASARFLRAGPTPVGTGESRHRLGP